MNSRLTRRQWLEAGFALAAATLPSASVVAQPKMSLRHAEPVRLSLNENPLGPSPLAIQAIHDQLTMLDRYVEQEATALENQIASQEGVSPDQIILGEILDRLGLQLALSSEEKEFIYSEPGYTALVDAVAPGGGVTIPIPLNARLENDLPAIANKVGKSTRAIYVVNPHNPTGTVSEKNAFKAFVREIAKHTLVIVDEAYLEFEPDFEERSVASSIRAGNVIVFRTFGKIYGLAGLSIGYAIAPKPLAAFLKAKGLGAPLELNRLALAAASGSLKDTRYIPDMRALIANEQNEWNQTLRKLGVRHTDSAANFIFLETKRPHREFATALLANGVDIGRSFPPLDTWARISIGLPAENAFARSAVAKVLS